MNKIIKFYSLYCSIITKLHGYNPNAKYYIVYMSLSKDYLLNDIKIKYGSYLWNRFEKEILEYSELRMLII